MREMVRYLVLGTVALAVALPASSRAQPAYFEITPAWATGPAGRTEAVCAGDVDGDGDLDLVFGNDLEGNTLYINEDGQMATTPAWTSQPAGRTRSVALGDVDGDGDLDLVCGNDEESNTLYLNTGGVFTATPVWSSGPANRTWCVALGDVDDDGDLDLVCGNYGANTLYRNDGGVFTTAPVWTSGPAGATRAIAIGDIDGDGDLDIVCGNLNESNAAYLSAADTVSTVPAWSSGPAKWTVGVALGDIDGDGRLDLAFANNADSNTVYLTSGGGPATTPSWIADAPGQTSAVVLADVDGDGDLDLASANSNQSSTVYVNNGGVLATVAAWLSGPAEPVSSITAADLDGDGAPELVCGVRDRASVFYRNLRPPLSASAVWSNPADLTRAVALGDVDGDGVLDLVCGNEGRSNTLYPGTTGSGDLFATAPAWTSGPANDTYGVALGDVDGDGDLDLVCGNLHQGNTLYRNDGGALNGVPEWMSGPPNATRSVALGDIDGDGDLDLACGNDESTRGDGSQHNTIYLNSGGSFAATPAWSSGPAAATIDVALADMDGDGDLDLVCGNEDERNTIYYNHGGTLETEPSWSSDPANATHAVAAADIDGDGRLDLVCGNAYQGNTVYRNGAGGLGTTPSWSSSVLHVTEDLAVGDIDGDGDIDIACGNSQGENTLYTNSAGMPETAPTWTSFPATLSTYGIALGDIDRDGDLDLVCGNSPQGNTAYIGLRNPPATGDPLAPVNQRPNNGAHLREVAVSEVAPNHFRISFRGVDVESDPFDVVTEYQFEGDPVWYPAAAGAVTRFASSPAGVRDSLEWDVTLVPFDPRDVSLRLRAIESPSRVAVHPQVSSYITGAGMVVPIRAQVETVIGVLDFPTVTAGDTVVLALQISNRGTATLVASDIGLPSGEMSIDMQPPLAIGIGETFPVSVRVHPVLETDIVGDLIIESNDPLDPAHAVSVRTDIRGLNIVSRLIAGPDGVTLGDALTVIVTPSPLDTRIEEGTLHYRIPGSTGFTTPLFPSGSDFVGIIPAEHVTEAGVEYYVEVRNLPARTLDPGGAPDSVYSVTVPPPADVTALAQPNSGGGFLRGRDVLVLMDIERGAVVDSAFVHYRRGGERDGGYQVAAVDLGGALPSATIPGGDVGPRGVEFWLEAFTLTRRLTDPPVAPAAAPHVLRAVIPDLAEPAGAPGNTYRMVTVPLEFAEDFTGTIEALLSDQPEFGSYDPVRWRAWTYVPESGGYRELSHGAVADRFRPQPGRAWWLICAAEHRVSTAPIPGTSVSTAAPFVIEVAPSAWTMVGSPFVFAVDWDSVRVDTTTLAAAAGVLIDPPLAWNGGSYTAATAAMEPFASYWVYNRTAETLALSVPPIAALNDSPPPSPVTAAEPAWELWISAGGEETGATAVAAGEAQGARAGLDRYDRVAPPPAPNGGLEIYAVSDGRRLSVDMRPLGTVGGGNVWNLDIAHSAGGRTGSDNIVIEVAGVDELPAGVLAAIVDTELHRRIDLHDEPRYSFYSRNMRYVGDANHARFRLIAGPEPFVERVVDDILAAPVATALYPNRPNPFNPATVVRYDVHDPGRVRIAVYDVRGALVRVLEDRRREPGRYEVGWDGTNREGERVSSGVYFCRMTAPGFAHSRKMVVLK